MQRKKSRGCLVGVAMLLLLCCVPSQVQAQEASYSSMVVQNRKHLGTHEFDVSVGLLPLDAFTKGLTIGASYTLHFTEHIAWELAQFNYAFHWDTDLKDDLRALDVRETPFEVIDFFAMSNFVLKPLYWKGSWFNESLLYGELFFVLGGGYVWRTASSLPAVDIGTGFRLHVSEPISLRFDARYLLMVDSALFESFDVKDDLWISLGFSVSI
ncbi:MAG: outer membrane beta-barrel domain-containing protein [Myxococcota bacterium]|jgi:outer membrane beta-barrel protein|nr:outer membrane beta-barrel domain-containing protein [Myxococcota bacterium]